MHKHNVYIFCRTVYSTGSNNNNNNITGNYDKYRCTEHKTYKKRESKREIDIKYTHIEIHIKNNNACKSVEQLKYLSTRI